jgi:hypothetical protein
LEQTENSNGTGVNHNSGECHPVNGRQYKDMKMRWLKVERNFVGRYVMTLSKMEEYVAYKLAKGLITPQEARRLLEKIWDFQDIIEFENKK